MRAVSRVTVVLLAVSVALAPAIAGAQQTTPAGNTTTSDTVGPPQLQNFSLPGTVTRPADRPATTAPATTAGTTPAPRTPPATRAARAPATAAPASRVQPPEVRRTTAPAPRSAVQTSAPPPPVISTPVASQPAPTPSFAPAQTPEPAASSRPTIPLFAWLLAALAIGVGGALLFRRNRARQAYAGGDVDEYVAPEAASAPPSAPVPPPAPPPVPQAPSAPAGIVSTRLRPRLEIAFRPLRCVLDHERATIDFELDLFNAGSAPARDIFIDATAFNAGPTQDALIAGFFDSRREQGHAIEVLAPLDRTMVPLQLALPRDQLQPYELGGQQVFVPLVAFNATYGWGSGSGQTAASYLLGRQTQGEKLAPFRLEAGPRIFRSLGAKALPAAMTK